MLYRDFSEVSSNLDLIIDLSDNVMTWDFRTYSFIFIVQIFNVRSLISYIGKEGSLSYM